jgi:GTPase Era involved in 16S rRNA processing
LFENKEYDIIHKNEDILEYIKNTKNIVVLSLNEIDPENEYDKDELIEEYKKRFSNFTVIFID